MGSGFESGGGVYQGKWLRQAEKVVSKGQSASARTYLGRLKKSRDLVGDKSGQFRIAEIGRVAVSRCHGVACCGVACCGVARQRKTATGATGEHNPANP